MSRFIHSKARAPRPRVSRRPLVSPRARQQSVLLLDTDPREQLFRFPTPPTPHSPRCFFCLFFLSKSGGERNATLVWDRCLRATAVNTGCVVVGLGRWSDQEGRKRRVARGGVCPCPSLWVSGIDRHSNTVHMHRHGPCFFYCSTTSTTQPKPARQHAHRRGPRSAPTEAPG